MTEPHRASSPSFDYAAPPAAHRREGIRPPKFAGKFAALDFDADPMPVISMFPPPATRERTNLRVAVRGDDLKTRIVTWSDLAALPAYPMDGNLICQIFNWHEPVAWRGFRLSDALDHFAVDVDPLGYLAFHAADGAYFETLSLDDARDPRAMLAFEMNGQPLPHQYGGPLRLVVPFLQGYKSVKWLDRVEAFRNDPVGIKRLLAQSKTARLGQAWLDRLSIDPPTGRPSDPVGG